MKNLLEKVSFLHAKPMDLGLERVKSVAGRLGVLTPEYPVLTVAGTNGKGSCVATVESVYLASGRRVGVFMSPYLHTPLEQIRFLGKPIEEDLFLNYLLTIEQACDDVTLTEFEIFLLVALLFFKEQRAEVIILEVGMGGR